MDPHGGNQLAGPSMSTPSCRSTVAPFDQMVTAPPPGSHEGAVRTR
ncbi:hypothetical protein I552_8770 [Mycobacterium xenopi 3993]|nr:hypothetical protein I552_8770 [Mycobacterium xenopi 3993]